LDFLTTILLKPGDTVLTEETVSPDVYRAIELAGGEIVTVPMDKDGITTYNLYGLIEQCKPKFIYVNSGYHNPTGRLLSLERRRELLDISYRYRLPIIEEDEASELYYEDRRLPSIKSMDKGENVIHINSFSLTLAPGVGISFVIAPKCVIKSLQNLVSVRLITLDWTPQRLTCQYLKTGVFRARLETFRKEYREKRDLMCSFLDEVKEELGLRYNKPSGGVYLWLAIPASMPVNLLEVETERRGVTFIPGEIFFPRKNPDGNYIRLNYSYPTAEEIKVGMKILIESMQKIRENSKR
jgi:DNA-binding transcriptional MocR family regulator